MGLEFETFLTIVLPIILGVVALLFIFRQPIRRMIAYIQAWKRRDEDLDAESARCREQALKEVSAWTGASQNSPPTNGTGALPPQEEIHDTH